MFASKYIFVVIELYRLLAVNLSETAVVECKCGELGSQQDVSGAIYMARRQGMVGRRCNVMANDKRRE